MEAVPPDPELLAQAPRQRVRRGFRRQRRVEGRVEDGDVGDAGKRASGLRDCLDRRAVVERCELGERRELALEGVVDDHGVAQARAAVDDPVRDGVDPPRAASSDSTGVELSPRSTLVSFRLVEPALTTSTAPILPDMLRPFYPETRCQALWCLAPFRLELLAGPDELLLVGHQLVARAAPP